MTVQRTIEITNVYPEDGDEIVVNKTVDLEAPDAFDSPDEYGEYLEGDVYGHLNGDFDAMLLHASDRLIQRYPTIALASIPTSELVPVATYDTCDKRLDVFNAAALAAWRS